MVSSPWVLVGEVLLVVASGVVVLVPPSLDFGLTVVGVVVVELEVVVGVVVVAVVVVEVVVVEVVIRLPV